MREYPAQYVIAVSSRMHPLLDGQSNRIAVALIERYVLGQRPPSYTALARARRKIAVRSFVIEEVQTRHLLGMKTRHAQKVRVPDERREAVSSALSVDRIESAALKTARGNRRRRGHDHRLARDDAMIRLHGLWLVRLACSRDKSRNGATLLRLPEASRGGCY